MKITISGERTEDGIQWNMQWKDITTWNDIVSASASLFYLVVEGSNPELDDPAITAIYVNKFFGFFANSLVSTKTAREDVGPS